ncbi:MAG TPA: hypothetical protein VHA13_02750, partial [Gammaproteobacteria bacterium]|nr:hypothetical protein [Gammaproteobacteria bacterium]
MLLENTAANFNVKLLDFKKTLITTPKMQNIYNALNKPANALLELKDLDNAKIKNNKRHLLYAGMLYILQQTNGVNMMKALDEVMTRLPLDKNQKRLLALGLENESKQESKRKQHR